MSLIGGLIILSCFAYVQTTSSDTVITTDETRSERLLFRPTVDVRRCPSLRIAIVNGVNFHFEVLGGLLHVLRGYEAQVDVFMSPWIRQQNYDGSWDLIRWSRATFRRINIDFNSVNLAVYDLAILVSPDYELRQNQLLLEHLRPRVTIAIVHNADFGQLPSLLNMTTNLHLAALSPHVAVSLEQRTGRKVFWMLATYPVRPAPDCTVAFDPNQILGLCLRGFAMQGKFSNLRRNYSAVWSQMASHMNEINDPQVGRVFHMNVLGKGPDRLKLPQELESIVTVHRRLPFKSFYSVICHTLALVPSLANARYFTHKFSSTVITSLSTGTPMIASKELLQAYSFLDKESVFPQEDGEEEVQVMTRVSRMPVDRVLGVRARLRELRLKLNQRSLSFLERHIRTACDHHSGT